MKLHLDIETYSSVDISKSGSYKYIESQDFEILMLAYALDEEPVRIVDLTDCKAIPYRFIRLLKDKKVNKCAHNANFERNALKKIGLETDVSEWECSMVKAAYCGLPLGLDELSKALKLTDKAKSAEGKALIRYFSSPVKATKKNGGRTRNYPEHDFDKWFAFKSYCIQDVEAEREVTRLLSHYEIPTTERHLYQLDQQINDRGVLIDTGFVKNAIAIDTVNSEKLTAQLKRLTGLENPNSTSQLKNWLGGAMKTEVGTLAKDAIPQLIEKAGEGYVSNVLELRQKASKTSVKKYEKMLDCVCADGRARGLFQFYGANRTGRWAGRLIQLQNLPQNHLKDLTGARKVINTGNYLLADVYFEDIAGTLSQLIRTAFIAPPGKVFAVADFSAIEARVIAWLSGEAWRLEVFKTHGKIYEASASKMFGVPIEEITKDSDYRAKGKVAELALGYQGSVGALTKMGGESMGLTEPEMKVIVQKWRKSNKKIVKFWGDLEEAAIAAMRREKQSSNLKVRFAYDGNALTAELPSGRKLFYWNARLSVSKFNKVSIKYEGVNQETKHWGWVDTYGGKIAENVTQAIARDLLADAMLRINAAGYAISMHVHDEVVLEVNNEGAEQALKNIEKLMSIAPAWAEGLPLDADGYITPYYRK